MGNCYQTFTTCTPFTKYRMKLLLVVCLPALVASVRYENLSAERKEIANHAFENGCLKSRPGGSFITPVCGNLVITEVINYQSQVVAGRNHRFTLITDWEGKQSGNFACRLNRRQCTFTVFEALQVNGGQLDITADSCCIGSSAPDAVAPPSGLIGGFQ